MRTYIVQLRELSMLCGDLYGEETKKQRIYVYV